MQTWRLIPVRSTGRGEVIARHLGLKPYWGKPTVRNFREGAGNVGYGRTRTPLRDRKSGDRKLPTYGCARLCSTRPDLPLDRRTSRPRPHADVCVAKQKREQGKPTTVSDAGDLVQVGTGK